MYLFYFFDVYVLIRLKVSRRQQNLNIWIGRVLKLAIFNSNISMDFYSSNYWNIADWNVFLLSFQAIEESVSHVRTVFFQPSTLFISDEDATLELRVKTVKYFKDLWSVHSKLNQMNLLEMSLKREKWKNSTIAAYNEEIFLQE